MQTVWVPWEPLWVRQNGKNIELRWGENVRRQQGNDMHETAKRLLPDYPWDQAIYSEWNDSAGVYVYVATKALKAAGRAIMVRLRSTQTATAYRTGKQSVTVKVDEQEPETRARMAIDAMLAQDANYDAHGKVIFYPYNSGYMAVLYEAAQSAQ